MREIIDVREFDELSMAEKIQLVQDLWDRIVDEPEAVGVTEAQRKELERRLVAHEQRTGQYTSWAEVRRRLVENSQ